MQITTERVELYSYVPPPGKNIHIFVQPLPVEDSVPTEDNIEWAVTQLRNHRSGGSSGMPEEHLKRWLAAARKAEKDVTKTAKTETTDNRGNTAVQPVKEPTEADNWVMVVDLIQTAFQEGMLSEEATWQAVVLITKGKKYYRGIGLLEVMWKVVAVI